MRSLCLIGGLAALAITSPALAQNHGGGTFETLSQISACKPGLARERNLTPGDYRARTKLHKESAIACAQSIPSDGSVPEFASKEIRAALSADILEWRDEFHVGRKELQDVQERWLIDRDLLTPWDWAQRRVEWFFFRDAWIANQRTLADADPLPARIGKSRAN